MNIARPTVTEERWLLLADRYRALRSAVEATGNGGAWKTTTPLGRGLGFLLGLFGTSFLAGALSLFPSPLLVGGLLLIIAAEWLVAKRRFVRSGIEEAVYLCGAIAVAVQLLLWSDGNNEALGVAFISTAVLLAGWRLMNLLFTTLAAAGYSLAIALAGGSLLGSRMNTLEAGIACAVLAIVALVAGGRQLRRPSHDQMLDGLVIVMPWLAYGWLVTYGWGRSASIWMALALALGFFTVNVVVGVKRRRHAPLISALGSLVCAGYALHELLRLPLHWMLIVDGALLLAVAVLLDRRLRNLQVGVTSRKLDESASLDLLQLAGAAHITPAPAATPASVQGQGGEFGGGGASGRF